MKRNAEAGSTEENPIATILGWKLTRNKLIEMGLEGSMVTAGTAFALDKAKNEVLVSYVPRSEETLPNDLPDYAKGYAQLVTFWNQSQQVKAEVSQLGGVFNKEFLKSRRVHNYKPCASLVNDGKGNLECKSGWKWETEYYWEVPEDLQTTLGNNDEQIISWQNNLSFTHGLNETVGSFKIDSNNPNLITFKKEKIDTQSRSVANAVGAGAATIGFKWYEEAANFLGANINPKKNVPRRSLLKLIGLGAGVAVMNGIEDRLVDSNTRLLDDLKATTRQAIENVHRGDEDLSHQFFGVGLNQTIGTLVNIIETSGRALENSTSDDAQKIVPQLRNLNISAQQAKTVLLENFGRDENTIQFNEPARTIQKSVLVTKEVTNAATGRRQATNLDPVLTTGALALVFAASAAGIEGLNAILPEEK